jgi:hypothetical protein
MFQKHLKAAAQLSTDTDEDELDSGPGKEIISIPTVPKVKYSICVEVCKTLITLKYPDPLHFIFDYVAGVSNKDLSRVFVLRNFGFTAIA